MDTSFHSETCTLTGHQLLAFVEQLAPQADLRRLVIRQDEQIIVELRFPSGLIAAAVPPLLAAIKAVARLIRTCTIEVEHSALVQSGQVVAVPPCAALPLKANTLSI